MGREDLAVYDRPAILARKVCKPLLQDGKPVDPVAFIAERAKDAPITMIGEGHGEPLTRAFNLAVASALRPLGYDVYAAETFSETVGETGPSVPLYSDGYYSREPIYGRLIRRLRALGFTFVPYEADGRAISAKYPPSEREEQRRIEQATHLANQVKRHTSKILVHAGEGNHSEYSPPNRYPGMGARFNELTGLDPLTIENIAFEAPGDAPVVCDPAQFAGQPHAFDIHIAMPKVTFERGRPKWRIEAGDHLVGIPPSLLRTDQIAVYEARPAGERVDSVPMDRVLLRAGEALPLLLPPGRFDVTVWTERDGWSANVPISVR